MLKFESLEPLGFRVTNTETNDTSEYYFNDRLSLWQIKQMGFFLEELLNHCGKMGSAIVTMLLSAVQSKSSESLVPFISGLGALSKESLGDGAVQGMAEITGFIVKENRLERLAAILFLKKGEKKAVDIEARIKLFEDELELDFILGAAKRFFGSKVESWKNTLSLSSIFETPKNEPAIQTSESSTNISPSSTDSSTPLPKDIQSESPIS